MAAGHHTVHIAVGHHHTDPADIHTVAAAVVAAAAAAVVAAAVAVVVGSHTAVVLQQVVGTADHYQVAGIVVQQQAVGTAALLAADSRTS